MTEAIITNPSTGATPNIVSMAPQPEPPKAGGGLGKKIIIALFLALVLGSAGYAGAAFYLKLWPFRQEGAPLSKQVAFAGMFEKMQYIASASYHAALDVRTEAREPGATAFQPASFPEFMQEMQMYQRDQDRLRNIAQIQTELRAYRQRHTAYPAQLSELDLQTTLNTTSYLYTRRPENDDYSLVVTFETDAAIRAVQNALYDAERKATTQIDGKAVAFSKRSETNFYFSSEPPKPHWASLLEEGDSYYSYIPAEFVLNLNAGGTAQKNKDAKADAQFQLDGEVSLGGFNVAAGIELRKKGEVWYGQITKFPSLFIDLSSIKNKWIKVTLDDLIGADLLADYMVLFWGRGKKDYRMLEQLQTFFKTMEEEKVLLVDYTLADEQIGDSPTYVYGVTFDETRVVPWYERLSKELKEKFGDEALLQLDDTSLRYMKTEAFQKYLAYLKNNTAIRMLVDQKSGYPVRIFYRFRIVPSDRIVNARDKQVTTSLTVTLSDINQPVRVVEPSEFTTFEEVHLAMTGQSREVYQFNRQQRNINVLRGALNQYRNLAGEFPSSLELLTRPREEASLKNIQPDNRRDFYDETLNKQPFIGVIPKDVFSGQSYSYLRTGGSEGYRLKYMMNVPASRKQASESGGASGYGQRISLHFLVTVVNGINTATAVNFSEEASAALKIDTDADGLPDHVEKYYGSDPNNVDSDGDGYRDGDEVKKGYDPAGPGKLNFEEIWYGSSSSYDYFDDYDNYNNSSSFSQQSVATAKGTMSSLRAAAILCQDSSSSIQTGSGSICNGKTIPIADKPLCMANSIGTWEQLPFGFTYGVCNDDYMNFQFSYSASNGICTITCTEKNCTYSGCD